MAKKKKKKAKKSVKPKKSASSVKTETSGSYIKTIIIAGIIFAAAIAAGAGVSFFRSVQLKKSAVISKTSTESITIKDSKTNKTYEMKIDPASAKIKNQVTPVKPEIKTKPSAKELFAPAPEKAKIIHIDIEDAKYLYDSGKAVFLDARGDASYNMKHIKGAFSMPLNKFDAALAKYKSKFKNKVLVAYCHGVGCHLSDKLAYRLYDAGYKKVLIFFGGWQKWEAAKYPDAAQAK